MGGVTIMGINYLAVLLATVAQFAIGAIWYMPIFGKLWGEIHGFNKMSKSEQKEAQRGMLPLLLVQLIITALTTVVLAKFFVLLPNYAPYSLAALIWIGFFVPVQIAAVIFGDTKPKWFVAKTLIMSSGSYVCLLAATAILTNIK